MKYKIQYTFIFTLFICFNLSASNQNTFKKNYKGMIGSDLMVEFHIENSNGKITGFYYYQRIGIDIKIIGSITDRELKIYELDYKNDTVAIITAIMSDLTVIGDWINVKTKKKYSISLEEISSNITPLPNDINGRYIDEQCDIVLDLSISKGEYYYKFVSKFRTLEGKISFSRGSENYIILEGIEFAEDYFDVALPDEDELYQEYKELAKKGNRHVGIECFLDSTEITIQNYSNAMNYYVKLYDCDEKYINLFKQ